MSLKIGCGRCGTTGPVGPGPCPVCYPARVYAESAPKAASSSPVAQWEAGGPYAPGHLPWHVREVGEYGEIVCKCRDEATARRIADIHNRAGELSSTAGEAVTIVQASDKALCLQTPGGRSWMPQRVARWVIQLQHLASLRA